MKTKSLEFTAHAMTALGGRSLELEWVERAVFAADWNEPDLSWANVERRFKMIPENGSRILRVVCLETDTNIRIISAFFDRKAKRPT